MANLHGEDNLFVFEGLPGAGKTPLIQTLEAILGDNVYLFGAAPGMHATIVKKQYAHFSPSQIGAILTDRFDESYEEHDVAKRLKEGQIVLADRGMPSIVACSVAAGADFDEMLKLADNFPWGRVIYLDFPPEISVSSREVSKLLVDKSQLKHDLEFQKKVYDVYKRLIKMGKIWLRVDATARPRELMHKQVFDKLKTVIPDFDDQLNQHLIRLRRKQGMLP